MSAAFICWEAVSHGPASLGSALAIVLLALWLAFNSLFATGYALPRRFGSLTQISKHRRSKAEPVDPRIKQLVKPFFPLEA